mgnify:CR=1 FL=1
MKYSIVVPLYNKEKYIDKTIQSVLQQTEQDFELIVVDDGSTDNSASVVKKIQNPKIRLIRKENGGVSSARNLGIRQSSGDNICFLDGDDTWEPFFLETISMLIEKFPKAGFFSTGYQVSYGKRVVLPKFRSTLDTEAHLINDFFEMATGPFWACNSSNAVVKREVVLRMDKWFPENESVYEDFDFWIRIGSTVPMAHSNKVCSTYNRVTEDNARTAHYCKKEIYSATFMQTLNNLLKNVQYSNQQKKWIKSIIDRRMVPYVFSLLCIGEREKAKRELNHWDVSGEYKKYKVALQAIRMMPQGVLNTIQEIRSIVF